jgi:hypothetical protein
MLCRCFLSLSGEAEKSQEIISRFLAGISAGQTNRRPHILSSVLAVLLIYIYDIIVQISDCTDLKIFIIT